MHCHHTDSRDLDVIPGRTWVHVAEWLGSRENGQRTARWSYHVPTGRWYLSEGWKRANKRRPLDAEQSAYVERLLADAR